MKESAHPVSMLVHRNNDPHTHLLFFGLALICALALHTKYKNRRYNNAVDNSILYNHFIHSVVLQSLYFGGSNLTCRDLPVEWMQFYRKVELSDLHDEPLRTSRSARLVLCRKSAKKDSGYRHLSPTALARSSLQ